MSRHSEDGAVYRRLRKQFLQNNPWCWICGHPGADQVDHDPPRAIHRAKLDLTTWRPAHGTNRCPTCGQACNQKRGTKNIDTITIAFRPALNW